MALKTGTMAWFDFSVTEKSRLDFYQKLFGWSFTSFGPNYWGINLDSVALGGIAVVEKANFEPASGFTPYLTVPSAKEGASMIKSLGGTLVGDVVAITNGDDGYFQKFCDADGNNLAVWSKNP